MTSRQDQQVRQQRVLAIASAGGHWVQLLRMAGAFQGHDVAYVTTTAGYRPQVGEARYYVVVDGSRWSKCRLIWMAIQLLIVLLRERPDVVISTGAAPGYFGLRLGKLLNARTIWVDSMANVEALSLCGERIQRHADLWLTQWPHLSRADGPEYAGSVL